MLDLTAYQARAWQSWQVFALGFAVYFAGIVMLVHRFHAEAIGATDVFAAALLAAVAVTGLGYQECRRQGGYRRVR